MNPSSDCRWEHRFECGARLCVEPLSSLESLRERVSRSEWQESERFTSTKRRCEYLGWRALCRDMMGVSTSVENLFEYNNLGAPHLVGFDLCVGVSHGKECVAVVLSAEPCAVDIEHEGRRFGAILPRYTTPKELMLSSSEDLYAQLWCAKEAMFKYVGAEGSYVADFEVVALDEGCGTGRTRFCTSDIGIRFLRYGEYHIAVII